MRGRRRVLHDCSGKHAGMLLACVRSGWPTDTYRSRGHPLQRRVLRAVLKASGLPQVRVGVDGCGVPVHAMPLRAMATVYARLAEPERLGQPLAEHAARAAAAMRRQPYLVGGRGRVDTEVMTHARERDREGGRRGPGVRGAGRRRARGRRACAGWGVPSGGAGVDRDPGRARRGRRDRSRRSAIVLAASGAGRWRAGWSHRGGLRAGGPRMTTRVGVLSVHTSPLDQAGSGDSGGMNVAITALATKLAARGVEVDLFTRCRGGAYHEVQTSRRARAWCRSRQVRVRRSPSPSSRGSFRSSSEACCGKRGTTGAATTWCTATTGSRAGWAARRRTSGACRW